MKKNKLQFLASFNEFRRRFIFSEPMNNQKLLWMCSYLVFEPVWDDRRRAAAISQNAGKNCIFRQCLATNLFVFLWMQRYVI